MNMIEIRLLNDVFGYSYRRCYSWVDELILVCRLIQTFFSSLQFMFQIGYNKIWGIRKECALRCAYFSGISNADNVWRNIEENAQTPSKTSLTLSELLSPPLPLFPQYTHGKFCLHCKQEQLAA